MVLPLEILYLPLVMIGLKSELTAILSIPLPLLRGALPLLLAFKSETDIILRLILWLNYSIPEFLLS